MVDVLQDERTVYEEDNHVIFEHINKQKYTQRAARNIWVGWNKEIENKKQILKNYSERKQEIQGKIEEQFSQQIKQIHTQFPTMDMVKLKHWKDVQVHLSLEQTKMQMEQLKKDIEAISMAIEQWKLCEKLPKTPEEEKADDKGKA